MQGACAGGLWQADLVRLHWVRRVLVAAAGGKKFMITRGLRDGLDDPTAIIVTVTVRSRSADVRHKAPPQDLSSCA